MNFREYLEEQFRHPESEEKIKTLLELEPIFRKYFPNGFFKVSETALSDGTSFWVKLGVINDLKDTINKIRDNDPMNATFMVNIVDDNYKLEIGGSGLSIYRNPDEGSYLAMQREKVSFRKSSGDFKKFKKSFENSVKKLRDTFDKITKMDMHRPFPEKYLK